jgi:hypothetical protein
VGTKIKLKTLKQKGKKEIGKITVPQRQLLPAQQLL